jgi:hypothetical protein
MLSGSAALQRQGTIHPHIYNCLSEPFLHKESLERAKLVPPEVGDVGDSTSDEGPCFPGMGGNCLTGAARP